MAGRLGLTWGVGLMSPPLGLGDELVEPRTSTGCGAGIASGPVDGSDVSGTVIWSIGRLGPGAGGSFAAGSVGGR